MERTREKHMGDPWETVQLTALGNNKQNPALFTFLLLTVVFSRIFFLNCRWD